MRHVMVARRAVLVLLGLGLMTPGKVLQAQRVKLRIHPHVGDTLRMKLDQRVEMDDDGVGGDKAAQSVVASMQIVTRTIVLGSTASGTELLSVTDSVSVTPAAAATLRLFAETKRALQGRTVRLRVRTDGAISLPGTARPSSSPPTSLVPVQVPAVLPSGGVGAGDSWVRDLHVPLSATGATTSLTRVTFHLDSLGPDAAIAYISLHGTFSHNYDADNLGAHGQTTGTLTGMMQVDRRLEWLTDSRMTLTLTSTVTPPGKVHPTRMRMKVTQWLRAIPPT